MTRAQRLLFSAIAAALLALVVVVAALNVYHEQHRLTRENLALAQKRWAAADLIDYDIQVTVGGGTRGVYLVQIRGGRAVGGTMNGLPFDPPERARSWTMDELLNTILERDLENDAKPDSPIVYTQVEFDSKDGHLIHYLRNSVRQNVTLDVRLEPARQARANPKETRP
jgi:hypothetical protein